VYIINKYIIYISIHLYVRVRVGEQKIKRVKIAVPLTLQTLIDIVKIDRAVCLALFKGGSACKREREREREREKNT